MPGEWTRKRSKTKCGEREPSRSSRSLHLHVLVSLNLLGEAYDKNRAVDDMVVLCVGFGNDICIPGKVVVLPK